MSFAYTDDGDRSSISTSATQRKEAISSSESSHGYVAELEVGGMKQVLQTLRELIIWPLVYSEEANVLGLKWPRGILLHGPPGTGKSMVVRSIAKESRAHFQYISSTDIFGAYSGESERKLRKIFAKAKKNLKKNKNKPSIIFIDEIDSLCPHRNSRHQHESRIVAQLLTLMDGIDNDDDNNNNNNVIIYNDDDDNDDNDDVDDVDDNGDYGKGKENNINLKNNARVVVIAATNRPNSIDSALRRPGRFDREISINIPNIEERKDILTLLTKKFPLVENFDMHLLASKCQGYVGADLASLCREAATSAISHFATTSMSSNPLHSIPPHSQTDCNTMSASSNFADDATSANTCYPSVEFPTIGMRDFEEAMTRIRPTMTRGLITEVPLVTWDDVGGLDQVKKRLQQAVEWPIKYASAFQRLGLTPPRGILLHGPPGCSKTTLARAVANSAKASFICLSGADVFSMYVGEGEKFLKDIFKRAVLSSPSIIFFDEVDTIATKRSDAGESKGKRGGSNSVSERILSCLLTEMDGLDSPNAEDKMMTKNEGRRIMILAATNRPQALDPALLRPGRFDLVLYVPPPDEAGRKKALEVHTRGMALAADVDLDELAKSTDLYTGAELANLCREASMSALRENLSANEIANRHFIRAKNGMQPSLTHSSLSAYAKFEKDALLRCRGR